MSRGDLARPSRSESAFTLTEVMAAMGASVIIIGGLLISSISMQRVLHGSQRYASAYSDQRRLIDFISRDLRRAVKMEFVAADGARIPAEGAFELEAGAALVLTLPGYYRSNAKDDATFQEALDVVGTAQRLDYGAAGHLASPVEVTFRKIGLGTGNGVGFAREEAGVQEVIVTDAENFSVKLRVASEARTASIIASFHGTYSRAAPLVSTADRILLRNAPLDIRP